MLPCHCHFCFSPFSNFGPLEALVILVKKKCSVPNYNATWNSLWVICNADKIPPWRSEACLPTKVKCWLQSWQLNSLGEAGSMRLEILHRACLVHYQWPFISMWHHAWLTWGDMNNLEWSGTALCYITLFRCFLRTTSKFFFTRLKSTSL